MGAARWVEAEKSAPLAERGQECKRGPRVGLLADYPPVCESATSPPEPSVLPWIR
jgi:hypothetical protein